MSKTVALELAEVGTALASTFTKCEQVGALAVTATVQGIVEAACDAWQHRERTICELGTSFTVGTSLASAQKQSGVLPIVLELGALSGSLASGRIFSQGRARGFYALKDAWDSPLYFDRARKEIAQTFGKPAFNFLTDETAAAAGAILRRVVPVYWKESSILNEMRRHHLETWSHSIRVGKLSEYIARELGLSRGERSLAAHAGQMHDAGKLDMNVSLLSKTGPLKKEDWNELRNHPIDSYNRLKGPWYVAHLERVPNVARCHHERLDGTGYPDQRTGDTLSTVEKLVPVADVFDALTAGRNYQGGRKALGDVKQIVDSEAGAHLEPAAVAALWRLPASKALLVLQRARRQPPKRLVRDLNSSGIQLGRVLDIIVGKDIDATAHEHDLAKAFSEIYYDGQKPR